MRTFEYYIDDETPDDAREFKPEKYECPFREEDVAKLVIAHEAALDADYYEISEDEGFLVHVRERRGGKPWVSVRVTGEPDWCWHTRIESEVAE